MPPKRAEVPKQHGVKGAYVGGDWVDIEDCEKKFYIKDGSCAGHCDTCPRSRSRNCAAKPDGSYDVVIVGAGCIGGAVARELAKYKLSVLLLEAADDVTQGATKGNSGIVHAGYDDKPGTNRAKYCWPGNQMFEALDKDLHFGYQKNGSLVVATSKEEEEHLEELLKRGETNGVKNLRIIGKEELFKLEPFVNPNATAALLAPDAGNLIPYEYTIALCENAVDNGVELRIRREVQAIAKDEDGGFTVTVNHWEPAAYLDATAASPKNWLFALCGVFAVVYMLLSNSPHLVSGLHPALAELPAERLKMIIGAVMTLLLGVVMQVLLRATGGPRASADWLTNVRRAAKPVGTGGRRVNIGEMLMGGSGYSTAVDGRSVETETIKTRFIVNAAGGASDKIARMLGDDSFKIKPRVGDYILLNRNQGHLATHTLFPCPGPLGKGVLVQTTLWGNLILGPTARDMHEPEMANMSDKEVQEFILGKCSNLVPYFDSAEAIHGFAGARAKSDRGDWIIEACRTAPKCIHAAGIDSPGLAGSPAIAKEVVRLLGEAGVKLQENPKFNPKRAPIITVKDGLKGLKMAAKPEAASKDPSQNVVCKCEKVTEEEVVRALKRSLPIDSTQGIRKRTRAGMGHCQGDDCNYQCEARVAAIIARETKLPVEAVGRRPWPATTNLPQRWITDVQKKALAALQPNKL